MKRIISLASLIAACAVSSCNNADNVQINFAPQAIITTDYLGNGVQWSAYPHAATVNDEWGALMTDQKWEMNFQRLDYMQPKLFRVLDQANWRYLVGFDSAGKPILNFDNDEVRAQRRILDYAQRNNITVLLGEWGTPFKVHDTKAGHSDKFNGADDPLWLDAIVEYLDFLIIQNGYTCIKYFNLVNEPNGDWSTVNGDFDNWAKGVRLLSEKIKARGLDKYISIAGPDAVTRYDHPTSKYKGGEWVEQAAKQLDDITGIYEVHDYTDYELVRTGGFEAFHSDVASHVKPTGKQIIFGELGFARGSEANQARVKADGFSSEDSQMDVYDYSYGVDMADAQIQSMLAGYSGSAAWALDDAMHTLNDEGDPKQLKRWGMWNSLGEELCNNPKDTEMRPWYYAWSILCRYIPTGSTIHRLDMPTIKGLRAVATTTDGGATIAIVNNATTPQRISLNGFEGTFKRFDYIDGARTVDADGFPTPSATGLDSKALGSVEIAANSLVMFTNYQH